MTIALVVYAYLRWRILAVERRAALERDLAEMERRALGLQMNPHFTFNALDSISSFIFKNDQKSAVRYLTSFAKLMRSTLEASREHYIPLQTEVGIIKHYADLESLRFSEPLDFQIEVDDDILFEALIPPMLIQPLVENAIKHGLRGLDRTPVLRVRFERVGDQLVVEVEDNGRGRAVAEQRDKGDHRSVGSSILERRLQLIGQAEKVQAQIRYEDLQTDGSPAGTRVILLLPYRKDHPGD
jgi:LytS/YehU family sensor histidine kinase